MKTIMILAILLTMNSLVHAGSGSALAIFRNFESKVAIDSLTPKMIAAMKNTRSATRDIVEKNNRKLEMAGKTFEEPGKVILSTTGALSKIMDVKTKNGIYTVSIGTSTKTRVSKKIESTLEIEGALTRTEVDDILSIFDSNDVIVDQVGAQYNVIIPIDTNDLVDFRMKANHLIYKITSETLGKPKSTTVLSRKSVSNSSK